MMKRLLLAPGLLVLCTLLFSVLGVMPSQAAKKEEKWIFIVETSDGTWQTGSTENTVGFDACGSMSKADSNGKYYLDKVLDKCPDPSKYWIYVDGDATLGTTITKNGSLHYDSSLDLFIYKGIAYNTNGAAYSNGHYFMVDWELEVDNLDLSAFADMDPLSYVDGFEFSDAESVRGLAADFYGLLIVLASAGMVLSLISAAMKIAAFGSGAVRSGIFEAIGYKILIFMAVCAFIGLFGLLGEFINQLSKI